MTGSNEISEGQEEEDILYGTLQCRLCSRRYPVVMGVAVLVPDVRGYFFEHAKGFGADLKEEWIPVEFREEFLEYREALLRESREHIEEDLESDRVNALYLMTHYLRVRDADETWWKAGPLSESPQITEWIERYWDEGPLEQVARWIRSVAPGQVVELACGTGGLLARIRDRISSGRSGYLGVDSSFHSIRIARHMNLGGPWEGELRIPGDLFSGSLSRPLGVKPSRVPLGGGPVDFIVGELDALPLSEGGFDICACMNAIDMLDDPAVLPAVQNRLLHAGGFAIQCAPYIWHERVSRGLRSKTPQGIHDSASAVEWLYEKAGFDLRERKPHIPWLFLKHLRQVELYSVHGFLALKRS